MIPEPHPYDPDEPAYDDVQIAYSVDPMTKKNMATSIGTYGS